MDLMKKRWAVLVASVIVNICIGTGFAWSVYQTGLFNEGAVIFGRSRSWPWHLQSAAVWRLFP